MEALLALFLMVQVPGPSLPSAGPVPPGPVAVDYGELHLLGYGTEKDWHTFDRGRFWTRLGGWGLALAGALLVGAGVAYAYEHEDGAIAAGAAGAALGALSIGFMVYGDRVTRRAVFSIVNGSAAGSAGRMP